MSMKNVGDPRTHLARDKYFSLRPKPLERWLWRHDVSQAAERVFWLHWEEGMRSGDWCSQIPLKRVALQCCIDPSTVTRAYQVLKSLDLIRREDPGRDPHNPFQQATAITEVRIPRDMLSEINLAPNRRRINNLKDPAAAISQLHEPSAATCESPLAGPHPTREQIRATWARTSEQERSRYFHASRVGTVSIEFDADTQLSNEERKQLLIQLHQMANARNTAVPVAKSVHQGLAASPSTPSTQHLSMFALARTRKRVLEVAPAQDAAELVLQVVWAMEEGALRRFESPLALNIALKKIREGAWTRPNRMPSNWSGHSALPETCNAA